jgi:hypothetical protein
MSEDELSDLEDIWSDLKKKGQSLVAPTLSKVTEQTEKLKTALTAILILSAIAAGAGLYQIARR